MTPLEIIAQVSARFDTLYYSDSAKLEQMIKDSMGVFQDHAGAIRSVKIETPETSIAKPADFLVVASTSDARGRWTDYNVTATEIELSGTYVYPVDVSYLVDFRALEVDDDLPHESIGLITKHFAACLTHRNTIRERNIAMATGMQRELPSDDVLKADISAVEIEMDDAMAIIPMSTVA